MFDELDSEISRLLETLDKFKGKEVLSEADTKGILIEPMLQTLEWKVSNFEDVQRERKVADDNFVDYALKISGTPKIFIETKALDVDLDDSKLIGQVIKYAAMEKGLKWCVLTNGNEYRLYKSDEDKLNAIDQMVFKVSIEECKDDNEKRSFFIKMMQLLSKDKVKSGELDRWISELFLKNRIRKIMRDPNEEFLNFIKDQIGTNASDEQVKAAMEKVVEKEVVIRGPEGKNGKPTWDGKKRHLEERCGPKTKQWLERIIKIVREITGVEEPIWNPKDYVAYKINNRIWLAIATHKDKLSLDFGVLAKSFSPEQIADRLGVALFDKKSSKAEKVPQGSSLVVESQSSTKDRVWLRIEEDFDLEQEEFKKFLQEIYKTFIGIG